MVDTARPSSLELFQAAIKHGIVTWQESIGLFVTHAHFGSGTITGIEPGRPYQRIRVHFPDGHTGEKILSETAFVPGIINDMVLPAAMESKLRSLLEQARLNQKQREAEERQREADAQAREQPIRRLAERAFIPIGQVRKDQWLYGILQKLARTGDLTEAEKDKLRQRGSHAVIAVYYELLSQRSGRRGYLASASSYWQYAGHPTRALEITEVGATDSSTVRAALLTTRGAAFRKLGNLAEAKRCALEALTHNPDSKHACNLLAGVYFDLGQATKGKQYFLIAAHYEAQSGDNDRSARYIVAHMSPEERKLAAALLLREDADGYNWAKHYLK